MSDPHHVSTVSRRTMLRSAALAGGAMAAAPLVAACGADHHAETLPRNGGSDSIALARAAVPRAIGGSGSVPAAVSAVQAFTVDLYRQLATTSGNVVCSPYSVAVALAMTRNGAKGQTASEMDHVLHAPELARFNQGLNALTRLVESRAGQQTRADGSKALVSLDVANSLWGQRGVAWQQPFLEALARYYGTGIRLVDYQRRTEAARTAINSWTATKTHDKIPEIIPEDVLDTYTRLVLVNAIYLKAPWEQPFETFLTKARPFTPAGGQRTLVDSMQLDASVSLTTGPGWQAARLPYAGGKLAMTIVLPTGAIDALEATLDAAALSAMLATSAQPTGRLVTIPKWKFRLAAPLKDPLTALGMPTAFDDERADLTGMSADLRLFVKDVLHQAFIAVDEHGTEAAAATAVVVQDEAAPLPPPPFLVDRPFLFVIHDIDTATPLFIGRVADPSRS